MIYFQMYVCASAFGVLFTILSVVAATYYGWISVVLTWLVRYIYECSFGLIMCYLVYEYMEHQRRMAVYKRLGDMNVEEINLFLQTGQVWP